MRDAFEETPIGLAYLHGPRLEFRATNAAYRAMWDRGSLVGLPMREALQELDSQYLFEVAERVFGTGEPVDAKEWRVPVEIGGALEEKFFDFQIQPRRDGRGTIAGVLIQVVDVTDQVLTRRMAEQAAVDAEERLRATRGVLVELQGALLPADLPLVPGVDVSASYLLAVDDSAAGGDWFDAVTRPDGRLTLVVGDVVGHGVTATAVMGQLRAVLRARLLSGVPITEALAGLDAYAATVAASQATTVCVAELDPATGEVTYCTAGHPPPLLIASDGRARFLESSGCGPLVTGAQFSTARALLQPDEMLVLYSDGLVERPGRTAPQATVELAQVAAQTYGMAPRSDAFVPSRTTERVCQLTLELLTRVTGHTDDITILAAQRVPEIAPVTIRVPASPTALRAVREALADWLAALELQPLDTIAVQHAVGELVANAVEHAYVGGDGGEVHLYAQVDRAGELVATVSDAGTWRSEVREAGGRGLALIRDLVDALTFTREAGGTTVTLRHRLSRPARLSAGTRNAAPPRLDAGLEVPFRMEVDETTDSVHVRGPLDLTSADHLRRVLLRTGRGGSRVLTVDLSAVTLLASAGVQALYELRQEVDLVAPLGTPAQHILQMVGLPYRQSSATSTDDDNGRTTE